MKNLAFDLFLNLQMLCFSCRPHYCQYQAIFCNWTRCYYSKTEIFKVTLTLFSFSYIKKINLKKTYILVSFKINTIYTDSLFCTYFHIKCCDWVEKLKDQQKMDDKHYTNLHVSIKMSWWFIEHFHFILKINLF